MTCTFSCWVAIVIRSKLHECGSQEGFLQPLTLYVVSQSCVKLCGNLDAIRLSSGIPAMHVSGDLDRA